MTANAERPRFFDAPLRQLLRNASWLSVSDGVILVADLIGTMLVARVLGVTDYGRLSLVWAVTGTAALVVDVRAWEAVTRYLSEFITRGQKGPALATVKLALLVDAAVALLGFGLAWAASGLAAGALFADPSLGPLIMLGALSLVASSFDRTARAVLRVFDRFRALSLCGVLEAAGRLTAVAGALAAGGRVRGVLLAHVAADAGAAAILLAVAGRAASTRLWAARASAALGTTRPYCPEMLRYLGHSSLRATLKLATRQLDVLVLRHHRPPSEVGLYRAALRLALVVEELTDPLYFAVFPQFARAWVEARDEFRGLLRRLAVGLALLTGALCLGGVLAAPALIGLTLGAAYAQAVEPFQLLLLATGAAAGTLWATPAVLGSGQPWVATKAAIISVVGLVGLLLVLVPLWGASGAAWARVGGAVGYLLVIGPWLARTLRSPITVECRSDGPR